MNRTRKDITILHGNTRVDNFGDVLLSNLFQEWASDNNDIRWVTEPREDHAPGTRARIRDYVKCKRLIFIGGGYFTPPRNNTTRWALRNIAIYAFPLFLVRLFQPRAGIHIIGVGFGRLPWLFHICMKLLIPENSEIIVRDRESLEFATAYSDNVKLGADAALQLHHDSFGTNCRDGSAKKRILLHITVDLYCGISILAELSRVVDVLSEHDVTIITDTRSRRASQEKLAAQLEVLFPGSTFERYQNSSQLVAAIRKSDVVITTKLHVGIVGCAFEKCTLSIPCHPKIERFYKDIRYLQNCFSFDAPEPLSQWIDERISAMARPSLSQDVLARAHQVKESFRRAVGAC